MESLIDEFSEPETKRACMWLEGLKKITTT
jgi:hypothetical protein